MIVRYGFLTPEKDIPIGEYNHGEWILHNFESIRDDNILKFKAWLQEENNNDISDFCMEKLGWIFVGLYSEKANIRKIRLKLHEDNTINNWQESRVDEYLMYGFTIDALR